MPQSRAFPMPAPLVSPLLAACAAALGLAAATLGAQSIPVLFAQTPAAPAPAAVPVSEAAPVVVQRDDDGLFMVVGDVNGRPVRFVVDTGATAVVLSQADADAAGIAATVPAPDITTASGRTAMHWGAASTIRVGGRAFAQVPVAVAPGGTVSLIGESLLGQFARVTISGDRMELR